MPVSITVLCPKLSCKSILRIPESARGQRVRCSACGTVFLVPEKKGVRNEVASGSKPESQPQ